MVCVIPWGAKRQADGLDDVGFKVATTDTKDDEKWCHILKVLFKWIHFLELKVKVRGQVKRQKSRSKVTMQFGSSIEDCFLVVKKILSLSVTRCSELELFKRVGQSQHTAVLLSDKQLELTCRSSHSSTQHHPFLIHRFTIHTMWCKYYNEQYMCI